MTWDVDGLAGKHRALQEDAVSRKPPERIVRDINYILDELCFIWEKESLTNEGWGRLTRIRSILKDIMI